MMRVFLFVKIPNQVGNDRGIAKILHHPRHQDFAGHKVRDDTYGVEDDKEIVEQRGTFGAALLYSSFWFSYPHIICWYFFLWSGIIYVWTTKQNSKI